MKLIRQLLELETTPPVEAVIGAVPCLTYWLKLHLSAREHYKEAAIALRIILAEGSDEHRKAAVDAGIIGPLSLMLDHNSEAKLSVIRAKNFGLCGGMGPSV